ncbi:unnamed protein product [Rotaria magnacalcarata]|uniref:Uncharacterized protein n=1 Tax=Rotaria magnacalcarata TaxID=392030 RepID=A0A815HU82_9BILA|nr:unnamed protein product [Rotaria magnacalcarata]
MNNQIKLRFQIRGIFKDLNEFFCTLSKSIRGMTYLPSITNELPPLTSASKTVEPSTSATYSCVTDLYIYLIRAPQKVPPTRTCKEEFVKDCRILYQDNLSVLKAIKEFDETYVPEEAIRWYTRDELL